MKRQEAETAAGADDVCTGCSERFLCSHACYGRWKCPTGHGPVDGPVARLRRGDVAFLENALARAVNLLSQIGDMCRSETEFDECGHIVLSATAGPDDQGVEGFMAMVRDAYPEF